jgi:hypothetical protein
MVELEQAIESDADRQVLRQDYVQLGSEKVDMTLSKQPDITVSKKTYNSCNIFQPRLSWVSC